MYNESFPIRTYGFQELASLYLPDIQPASASTRLKAWIKNNRALRKQLKALGFQKGQRMLTPEMVKAVVSIIGEP